MPAVDNRCATHGVDVISAYAICGAGGLVGAVLLRGALAHDDVGRAALRDSRLGFCMLAAGLLHPAFLAEPRPTWSQALLVVGAAGYVLCLASATASLAARPVGRAALVSGIGAVVALVLLTMPLGTHALALLLAWLLAGGVSFMAWRARALILHPREANERLFGTVIALIVPVHWLRAGYSLILPGPAPDHLLMVPDYLLAPMGLMYGVLPVLYVLLVFNVLHSRRQALLREGMMTDQLTGALSRHALAPGVQALRAQAAATGEVVALLLADVDHFKRVNDQHGHAVGDAVLRQVAQRIVARLRPQAFLVRYGGEEFLAVTPVPDLATARAVAERLRLAVAEPDGSVPAVTVSLGVALMRAEDGLEAALVLADDALYRAKNGGRNQVQLGLAAA